MGADFRPAIVVIADASRGVLLDELSARYARDYDLVAPDLDAAKPVLLNLLAAQHKVAVIACEYRLGEFTAVDVFRKLASTLSTARRLVFVPSEQFADDVGDLMDAQASGQIDGYFVIPKGPRDEEFHGGISEQLSEWTWVSGAVSIDVVRIFMDAPSADSARIIDFLDRSGVPHRVYPTDSPVAAEMLAEVGPDAALPLVQLVGGAILPCPSTADLAGLMQRAARSTAPTATRWPTC